MDSTADAEFARRRLMAAVAASSAPILSTQQIDDLMLIADPDGTGVFTDSALGQAAATGWNDKAAAAAAGYDDLGAGGGTYVKRLQSLHARCLQMAQLYRSGGASVLTGSVPQPTRAGVSSITMVPDNRPV